MKMVIYSDHAPLSDISSAQMKNAKRGNSGHLELVIMVQI